MLQIKNLTITHKKDLRELISGFSFCLNPKDKAVIIGEEGNGKSTLLKLIYQESLVEEYVEYHGEIMRDNGILGYLAQEMPPEDQKKSICEFCMEIPQFLEWTPGELKQAARQLGFSVERLYEDQKIETLSGGEKVKLQMFRLLLQKPDAYLLDEPSNDIDIDTLFWLEQFIKDSQVPVLYVSHDETLIERTANVVIHLEQRERKTKPCATVARVPYRTYIDERMAFLEKSSQQAKNEQREYEKQMEKFRRIQQKVEYQQAIISRQNPSGGRLLKKKMKAVKSMERRFEKEQENRTEVPDTEDAIFMKFGEQIQIPAGKTVLEVEIPQLAAGEHGEHILAHNIFLRMRGSEKVCIIGKNGAGKTTFLRQAAKLLLERTDIQAAYMPQNYEELLEMDKTPVEFLACSGEKEEITRVRTYLGSMKYTADEMSHPVRELSGGQKAKILLLKMSLSGAEVLILDEPTRNFSPLSGPVIREVLKSFGGAILSVSHDRKYIGEVCDVVYELTAQGLIPVSPEYLDTPDASQTTSLRKNK